MPVAAPVSYTVSPNPTIPVVISLSLYLTALLISACVIRYFHRRSTPPPYECHFSQPRALTNRPTHPHWPPSQLGFPSSRPQPSIPCTPLSSPPRPSLSPLKDSPITRPTSPANSSSKSYILSPSPRSSTSEPARTTYLTTLASRFEPPSPSSWDRSSNYSTPTPSTATWRSSLARFSIQLSDRSTSRSPEPSNNTTEDRQEPVLPLQPSPWPSESHRVPHHQLPPR